MPTINEVWEQAQRINANLVIVHDDLITLNACCERGDAKLGDLVSGLAELKAIANAGFSALANGLAGVQARQDITNQLLLFQAQQQATMICALENISRNTCGIWNENDEQTDLLQAAGANLRALEHMTASAEPEAALTWDRQLANTAELRACCPEEPRDPVCDYKPCPVPEQPDLRDPKKFGGFKRPVAKTKAPRRSRAAKKS